MTRQKGQRFTKDERRAAALIAFEIAAKHKVMARAVEEVEDILEVSTPTARRLIAAGKYIGKARAK